MILELVIFDMDGLMFDTEPLGAVCFARAAKQFGYIIEEEFRYKLIGINANDHYALMKSKFGQDCPAKEIHELSKKLRSDYLYKHGIVIKPGLFELITYLKNKGIKYLPDYIGSMYGEKLNQKYSDCNLVLNQRDYKVFEKVYHKKPEGLLPAAVEEPDFSLIKAVEFDFSKKGDKDRYILFVGSKYYPNIVGLSWFVKNVFLNLSDKFKLIVIGRGMECVREDYKDNNRIFIVGGVKFLAPFYNNADIVIAPLFDGGGMKQKTAEALAYGKTFVGTKESLYGYEDALQVNHNGEKIVFSEDSAEEQVKIFELIDKKNLYGRYKELTDLFKDNYSKDAIKNRLLEILK